MNWNVRTIEGQPFTKVVTEGDFNLEDHLKMLEDIVSRDFWKPGTNILFDHRILEFGFTNISTARGVLANYEKYNERIGGSKIAVIMKSVADYGRGRQFELVAEDRLFARFYISLVEKEAIEWLTS